jgi:hypothetical protein
MMWWRDIQYDNLTDYLNLLSLPVRRQRELDNRSRTELPLVSGALLQSKPEISGVESTGATATVLTQIVTRQPIGTTAFVVSRTPQGFAMVDERDGWRMADDLFVENRANLVAAAQQQSRKH